MRRCLVVLFISAMVASGLVFAQPASADVPSPYTLLDPVGVENVYRKNDIRSVRIVHETTVTLTVRTREGVNLATHAAWRDRDTYLFLGLITTPGGYDDYRIYLEASASGPLPPKLYSAPGVLVECPSLAFDLIDGNRYRFTLARSCIADPASMRVRATYYFDPPGPASWLFHEDRAGPSRRVAFAA